MAIEGCAPVFFVSGRHFHLLCTKMGGTVGAGLFKENSDLGNTEYLDFSGPRGENVLKMGGL